VDPRNGELANSQPNKARLHLFFSASNVAALHKHFMDPPPTLRDPGTLFYQKDVIRRSIISAYWAAIILSLPLWWYFTSIKRLSLPSSRVQQLAQQHLTLPISICIEANAPLVDQVQDILAARISQEPQRWKGLVVQLEGRANCGMLPSPKLHGLLHS